MGTNIYLRKIVSKEDMKDKISIKKENVLNAYKQATKKQKALLENMFGKDVFHPKNIMERVKTFEDACEVLGEEHPYVQEYRGVANINFDFTQDIIAYLKLRIICAALNEGWKPTFSDGECRYYPFFKIYTKKEYDELNENQKKELHFAGLSGNNANADGVFFSNVNYMSSVSITNYASRIALKTRKLAEYCGKQFIDIWAEFLFA